MKKVVKIRSKQLSIEAPSKSRTKLKAKVRLAIDCSPEERKYIKMYAAHEDETLNEFVLESVRMRMYPRCKKSHVPNEETRRALDATDRGEGLIHFDSVEDFFRSLKK